jgi:cytidylate kinase
MYLNEENVEQEIREMRVSQKVSEVAAIALVRDFAVAQQQAMGESKGIVMDGRDIGTVVFPDAELKIFMTASPETRAQRRFDELQSKNQDVSYDDVLKNVQERDYIDTHREDSPLIKADDAIEIDNSHLSREEQFDLVLELVRDCIDTM